MSAHHNSLRESPATWRIPLFLDVVREGNRFLLRMHGTDGLDLGLYGIPPEQRLPETTQLQ